MCLEVFKRCQRLSPGVHLDVERIFHSVDGKIDEVEPDRTSVVIDQLRERNRSLPKNIVDCVENDQHRLDRQIMFPRPVKLR